MEMLLKRSVMGGMTLQACQCLSGHRWAGLLCIGMLVLSSCAENPIDDQIDVFPIVTVVNDTVFAVYSVAARINCSRVVLSVDGRQYYCQSTKMKTRQVEKRRIIAIASRDFFTQEGVAFARLAYNQAPDIITLFFDGIASPASICPFRRSADTLMEMQSIFQELALGDYGYRYHHISPITESDSPIRRPE